jgi:polar amino acid transport system substrate-binding protein
MLERRGGWLAAGLLLLIGVAFATGAKGPEPALRVGASTNYPPLVFSQGGEIRGIEAELAELLSQHLGRSIAWVELPFAELIPALEAERIDLIMSGMSVTEARRRRVAFSEPYLEVGQMALIRVEDEAKLSEPDAMRAPGALVGFEDDTTGEEFARKELASAQLVGFESVEEGVSSLRARRIDFFIHDAPTIWRVVGGIASDERELTGLYTPLTREYLAWAVRPQDSELLAAINAAIAEWKEKGTLDLVAYRWIPVRKRAIEPAQAP